uniref:Putative secreted peptide n=1 Tax=Anopheles braziliensis TaxID=58242 RepID=A0A2M3ZS54_9DIPT
MAKKRRRLITVVGRSISLIACTRFGRGRIPCPVTRWPRNVISVRPNSHFAVLIERLCSLRRVNNDLRCSRCSVTDREATIMSSTYGNAKSKPLRVWCIIR